MELIGRRWAGAILYALTDGPLHFAELKESVPGMSDRLLSCRLKELEKAGLVQREVQPGSRVRVSYELTDKGHSLEPVMASCAIGPAIGTGPDHQSRGFPSGILSITSVASWRSTGYGVVAR